MKKSKKFNRLGQIDWAPYCISVSASSTVKENVAYLVPDSKYLSLEEIIPFFLHRNLAYKVNHSDSNIDKRPKYYKLLSYKDYQELSDK